MYVIKDLILISADSLGTLSRKFYRVSMVRYFISFGMIKYYLIFTLLRFLTSIVLIYYLKNGNISKAISFNKGFIEGL